MSSHIDNLENLSNKELHAKMMHYGLPNVGINDANRSMFIKKLRKAMNTSIPDGLEDLSNKELKAECNKWGLNNIPVTDSSRSVLIRRLRAAMAAGAAPINNEKIASTANQKKSPVTRRRTAAATNNNNDMEVEETRKEVKNKNNSTAKTTQRTSMISPIILHGSEDDDDSKSVDTTASSSFRRSPSLSKSGVFTTSYVQEVKPLKKHIEYDEEDDDNDVEFVDEYDAMDVDEANDVQLFEQYNHQEQQAQYIPPSFGPTSSQYAENIAPREFNHYDARFSGEYAPLHSSTISSPIINPTLDYEQPKANNFYEPIVRGNLSPIVNYQVQQPTMRETKLHRSTVYKTSTEKSVQPSKVVTKRHTSNTQAPTLYPSLLDLQKEQQIYNNVRLEDDLSESEETSQIELSSDDEATVSSRYASFDPQQPYMRRTGYAQNMKGSKITPSPRRPLMRSTTTTIDDSNAMMTPLRNFFNQLDRNYHVKKYFALLLTFIFVAFIYAFFF